MPQQVADLNVVLAICLILFAVSLKPLFAVAASYGEQRGLYAGCEKYKFSAFE
jgi:hypothetical protein